MPRRNIHARAQCAFVDGRRQPLGASHGSDVDAGDHDEVTMQRPYQLIRSNGELRDRSFEIQFLDPGVAAYAFTFGRPRRLRCRDG